MLVVLRFVYAISQQLLSYLKKLLRWVVLVFSAEPTPKGHVIT